MSVIQVPYHLDEYLPDLDVPLPPDVVINPELPAGDVWVRDAAGPGMPEISVRLLGWSNGSA